MGRQLGSEANISLNQMCIHPGTRSDDEPFSTAHRAAHRVDHMAPEHTPPKVGRQIAKGNPAGAELHMLSTLLYSYQICHHSFPEKKPKELPLFTTSKRVEFPM